MKKMKGLGKSKGPIHATKDKTARMKAKKTGINTRVGKALS